MAETHPTYFAPGDIVDGIVITPEAATLHNTYVEYRLLNTPIEKRKISLSPHAILTFFTNLFS